MWDSIVQASTTSQGDRWCGPRPISGRGSRTPRTSGLVSCRDRCILRHPHMRVESVPLVSSDGSKQFYKMLAAYWECLVRRGSEELMLWVFSPLRFATGGHLATFAERQAFSSCLPDHPARNVARPFPKGSCGIVLQKALHDDENACLLMGLWRSISDDPENPVELKFLSMRARWRMRVTRSRFAVFNGLVPHKTEAIDQKIKSSNTVRMHHTSHMKPQHEFIALAVFAPQHAEQLVFKEL